MIYDLPKTDLIHNALSIGMSLQDAYIYAGCTEQEISEWSQDEEKQREWSGIIKRQEYSLLEKLGVVIDKQVNRGNESALVWLLSRLNPRYTDKPKTELPDIHLHMDSTDPKEYDTVEINQGGDK